MMLFVINDYYSPSTFFPNVTHCNKKRNLMLFWCNKILWFCVVLLAIMYVLILTCIFIYKVT